MGWGWMSFWVCDLNDREAPNDTRIKLISEGRMSIKIKDEIFSTVTHSQKRGSFSSTTTVRLRDILMLISHFHIIPFQHTHLCQIQYSLKWWMGYYAVAFVDPATSPSLHHLVRCSWQFNNVWFKLDCVVLIRL